VKILLQKEEFWEDNLRERGFENHFLIVEAEAAS